MKGFTKDGKFHPITDYKGVRKSRDQSTKTKGVKFRKARDSTRKLGHYKYFKVKLNDKDFQELLELTVGSGFDDNHFSIKNNVKKGDFSTIEEVFTFLRKNKDATVEGALLGDFLNEEEGGTGDVRESWDYWLRKDTKNRYNV